MRRYEETPERLYFGNPDCVVAPSKAQLEGYEGMSMQLCLASKPWPQDYKFRTALDVWDFAKNIGMVDDVRERFYGIYANMQHVPMGYRLISAGSTGAALVDPKILFSPAIMLAATSVFCVHNHPSGQLAASPTDTRLLRRLEKGADLLGIKIRDFVIVSATGYYSFEDNSLMREGLPPEVST